MRARTLGKMKYLFSKNISRPYERGTNRIYVVSICLHPRCHQSYWRLRRPTRFGSVHGGREGFFFFSAVYIRTVLYVFSPKGGSIFLLSPSLFLLCCAPARGPCVPKAPWHPEPPTAYNGLYSSTLGGIGIDSLVQSLESIGGQHTKHACSSNQPRHPATLLLPENHVLHKKCKCFYAIKHRESLFINCSQVKSLHPSMLLAFCEQKRKKSECCE